MLRKLVFFIAVVLLSVFDSLAQKNSSGTDYHFVNDLQDSVSAGYWMNLHTRKQDEKNPGNFISTTNSEMPYGLGFESGIPENLKRKNIYLFIRAQLRIYDTTQHIILVKEISNAGTTIYWKGENVAMQFGKPNEWVAIHDSLYIPGNIPVDSKMKIYIWNQDGKTEADVDDLDIHLSILRTPTYLVY
jgi:hypothetical protein